MIETKIMDQLVYPLMKFKFTYLMLLFLSSTLLSCATAQPFTTEATIVQPAGSSFAPEEVQPDSSVSDPEQLYSDQNILLYLPAPANIASIPGDYGTIQTVILAPAISQGSVINVIPVALMEFTNGETASQIIISIPADPSLQVIKSPSLQQLQLNYPGVMEILSIWFTNAYSDRLPELSAIRDEKEAERHIKQILGIQ